MQLFMICTECAGLFVEVFICCWAESENLFVLKEETYQKNVTACISSVCCVVLCHAALTVIDAGAQ
jgi:hypothetical protein